METKMIGSKIAKARKEINMSQAQLADRLFISPQAVGKWERGESIPDLVTVNRLAEILGVDLNYFSENFSSTISEATPEEPFIMQSAVLSSAGMQENQLKWDMSRGNWVDADFSGLKGLHEKFTGSNLQRCKFIGSDMSGLLLKENHVDGCDFSGSDLSSSHLQQSHLVNNVFTDCSLRDAEFTQCHIKGCDFSGANLIGAKFRSSHLAKCTMANVVLNRTSFIASSMADIVFEGTLADCYFENTAFSRITFQHSTLTNTFFKGRDLKQITFIDCQADRITYEFLKNGKADVSGISLLT